MTLLPEVEHALMTAIGQPAEASPGPHRAARRERLLGPAVTVAMVSLTLATFVGALVLLHHGPGAGPSDSGGSLPSNVPSTRQTLLATLGALRRPEQGPKILVLRSFPLTGIDPTAPLPIHPQPHRRLTRDLGLARTVAVPGSPYAAGLVPVREAATRSAPATEALDLILGVPNVRSPGAAGRSPLSVTGPVKVSVLRARGVAVIPARPTNAGALVVPDGVARVQLGPGLRVLQPRGERDLTRDIRLPRQIASVTATVADNVAGFTLGRVNGRVAKGVPVMLGVSVWLQTTWYAADGRTIAHPRVPTFLWVHVHSPLR